MGHSPLFVPDRFSSGRPSWSPAAAESTIRSLLEEHFPQLGPLAGIETLDGVEINSMNFRVSAGDRRFVLKRRTGSAARGEAARASLVARALAARGVAVAAPIEARNGADSVTVDGVEWSASEHIEGDYFRGGAGELEAVCGILPALSDALRSLPPDGPGAPSPLRHDREAWHARYAQLVTDRSGWRTKLGDLIASTLEDRLEILADALDRDARRGSTERSDIEHIDLHPHNLLMRNGEVVGVLDLDSVRLAPAGLGRAFAGIKLGRQAVVAGRSLHDVRKALLPFDHGLARAELIRRSFVVLDLAYAEGDRRWAPMLTVQLALLAELDVLAPTAPRENLDRARGRRLHSLETDGAGALLSFERALAVRGLSTDIRVRQALWLATSLPYAHTGLSSSAYLAHPLRVAELALAYIPDPIDAVVRALVHNVLEVTALGAAALAERIGADVARDIALLTVDRRRDDDAYQHEYYGALGSASTAARQVKVLDKLDNLMTLHLNPDDGVRARYLRDVETHVLPMCVSEIPAAVELMRTAIENARTGGHLARPAASRAFPFPRSPSASTTSAGDVDARRES